MPNLSHRVRAPAPAPILFITCGHFFPPAPLLGIQPNAGTNSTSPNYSFRCLSCDIAHRNTQQSLTLETYNGLIDDQKGRLLIAAERKGTEREGRYDDEMVAEGERRIRNWAIRRAEEIDAQWKGFLDRWNGEAWYDGKQKRNFSLKLKVNLDMGFSVEGLPKDLGA
jgi:hypothetical protein